MEANTQSVIVVHGGAGSWDTDEERLVQALRDCTAAAAAGRQLLVAGGSALDAVEAAVRVMEESPVLQAGRGSHQNCEGRIQMDALICDGATLDLGAVAAVELLPNPISLARAILDHSPHTFLVADGAMAFADARGLPRCDLSYLLGAEAPDGETLTVAEPSPGVGDTVGAVALDGRGNVAAATSTGGTKGKAHGRVGDSPLIGSGGYADNWTGAASATGHGETLMKVVISKRVCDFIADGLSAMKACEAAVAILSERVNGVGGVIAIDIRGGIGFAFNTPAMPYAFAVGTGPVHAGS
jgi:L-asparaginase / beta-aspartyl-peptidase